MCNALLIKTKLSALYALLHLLKLNNIYKLEVWKFAYEFKMKTLLRCFKKLFSIGFSSPHLLDKICC